MIKNFFKIAYRNLLRNKGFSFINITGLAIGMASTMLIFLWIHDELGYDQFHVNKDRIYQVWNHARFNGEVSCWNTVSAGGCTNGCNLIAIAFTWNGGHSHWQALWP